MTDRVNGLIVTLESDLRDDEADALVALIRQIRGVCHVEKSVADPESHMAKERAKHELRMSILHLIV